MATRRLGIIMNGVTGRMGLNQHLVRSILAIREQGGVALPTATASCPTRSWSGAMPTRSRRSPGSTASSAGPPISSAALANPNDTVFFDAATTQMRADLLTQAIEAGKHIYCEKPVADSLDKALAVARLAKQRGIKNGVVQDKLFLPGPAQDQDAARRRLLRSHPLGARRVRLLGVRRRLGPAGAAAELELQEGRRRRHHPRHAVPLALRARQPVRRGSGGELPRRDAHPERVDETGEPTRPTPTMPPMRRSSSKAASSRTSTRPGACACGATIS